MAKDRRDKKPTPKTETGHETPVPKRRDFLRDVKRVSRQAETRHNIRPQKRGM
jgi:hypothetical protein